MKTIAFFNNKGGVGKTSLAYHLAWMYAQLGVRVIAADLDPQSNLSSMFLDEDRLEQLWPDGEHKATVLGAIKPLMVGTGDIKPVHIEQIGDTGNIGLVVGDLGLSSFEDELSAQWPLCADGKERAFRVISGFHRLIAEAGAKTNADVALIDVGPNLGAINRSAIIAADYIVFPLASDLFSLQGLRNLGPTLVTWRNQWRSRLNMNPQPDLSLPGGEMEPAGYVILQHAVRLDRPVKSYLYWMNKIPSEYMISVLNLSSEETPMVSDDPNCLALLKNYRSLMPLAMEARKPMFALKPADGAIGSHQAAVKSCYYDFKALALKIASRCGIDIPPMWTQLTFDDVFGRGVAACLYFSSSARSRCSPCLRR